MRRSLCCRVCCPPTSWGGPGPAAQIDGGLVLGEVDSGWCICLGAAQARPPVKGSGPVESKVLRDLSVWPANFSWLVTEGAALSRSVGFVAWDLSLRSQWRALVSALVSLVRHALALF